MTRITGALASLLLLTGCAPWKVGLPDWQPRYDREGNEVAWVWQVDASGLPNGYQAADAALAAGTQSGVSGIGVATGLVTALVSGIKNRGTVAIKITDFDMYWEQNGSFGMPWEEIRDEPWPGWEKIKPRTWVRLVRNGERLAVVACDPECPAVRPDPNGRIKPHVAAPLAKPSDASTTN